MNKLSFLLISIIVLVSAAGCATFGIRGESTADGREGRDYVISVNAWDKKADNLAVFFTWRVNGGPWRQAPAAFNGTRFEYTVRGSELPMGTLEYYAWMTNSKGKKVNSSPITVRILSYEQAKQKAAQEYLALLSDRKTPAEFLYHDAAVFALSVSKTVPAAVELKVTGDGGTQALAAAPAIPAQAVSAGEWQASIPTPHTAKSYTYQWTVTWQHEEFGKMISAFPAVPKTITVLDRAAIVQRIVKEFRTSFAHKGPASGTALAPPRVEARYAGGPFSSRYLSGKLKVELILRKGDFAKTFAMTEGPANVFTLDLPVRDLEDGALSYSFRYAASFAEAGTLEYRYPEADGFRVAYTSLADLQREAAAALKTAFNHAPPAVAAKGEPLTLTLVQTKPLPGTRASLFYRTATSARYREVPGLASPSGWNFTVRKEETAGNMIQYYFEVFSSDPKLGNFNAVLRDASGGMENDYLLIPSAPEAPAVPAAPAAAVPATAAPTPTGTTVPAAVTPVVPVVTAPVPPTVLSASAPASAEPSENPVPPASGLVPVARLYKGTAAPGKTVEFYLEMDTALGLYDVSVFVKVQNKDALFNEFPMPRKGKVFSYTFDVSKLPQGNRIDFYYMIYKKGEAPQNVTDANSVPFYAIVGKKE